MASVQPVAEPYTITLQALGQRWSLSVEGLRKRFHDGLLDGFQQGRSIRIFMREVQRIECQRPIGLSPTGSHSPSLTETLGFESRLEQMTSA